ncbi:MAG: hypothetical protein MH204_04990 [Fimbriimonadaceae bacterium]|nr:hypothetical protein [Fimbriimonadaceae bacterium]
MRPAALLPILLAAAGTAQAADTQRDILRAFESQPERIPATGLPDSVRGVMLGTTSATMNPFMLMMGVGGAGEAGAISEFFRLTACVLVDPAEFAAKVAAGEGVIKGWSVDFAGMVGAAPGADSMPELMFTVTYIQAGGVSAWTPVPDLTKASILGLPGRVNREGGNPALSRSEPGSVMEAPGTPPPNFMALSERMRRVQAVTMALRSFADERGRLPATGTPDEQRAGLGRHLADPADWPTGGPGRLVLNPRLADAASGRLADQRRVLIWEAEPANGLRVVGFTDTTVRAVSESEWKRLWAAESDHLESPA